jgi:hypothetical protein
LLRGQQQVFDSVFAFKPLGRMTVVTDGEAEQVQAQLVSADFHRGVGVAPVAGRAISPQDDVRGATETVAVISDSYWARRFGRSPSAIGTRVRVNEVAVTIVGANPLGFTGVDSGDRADVFMPLSARSRSCPPSDLRAPRPCWTHNQPAEQNRRAVAATTRPASNWRRYGHQPSLCRSESRSAQKARTPAS